MTWPAQANAILLLPSGHRAYDEDFLVPFPMPRTIDVTGDRSETAPMGGET